MSDEKITEQIPVYFKSSEMKLVNIAAKTEERSVSNFIRLAVMKKLNRFKSGEELEKKEE